MASETQSLVSTPVKVRKRRRYVLLAILAVVLLFLLWGGFTALTVRRKIESGSAHMQTVLAMVRDGGAELTSAANLSRIHNELAAAESDFGAARAAVWPVRRFLAPAALSPVGPGYDLAHLYDLLLLAQKGTESAMLTLDALSPAAQALNNTTPAASTTTGGAVTIAGGEKVLRASAALADHQADFVTARDAVNDVLAIRARIDKDKLTLDQARKALSQLDDISPALTTGLDLAQNLPPMLPDVLAASGNKQYLVVAQNSDELRPTGGFVSTVGLLKVENGHISLSDFRDSYAVDNPAAPLLLPPDPLVTFMHAGRFYIRDANFWPDFPTSAQTMLNMYNLHQGVQADGVVTVDLQAVAYILQALGPITEPEYGETVTAQNFQERIRFHYLKPSDKLDSEWWKQRKDFIGGLFKALVGRINSAGGKDYLKLADALNHSVAEKHVQAYFSDATLAQTLTAHRVDGALSPSPAGDYLSVVDTNVGFNKINAVIKRAITYAVTPSQDGTRLVGKVTIHYTNPAGVREGETPGVCAPQQPSYNDSYDKMIAGCYYNYLRVYVPQGSLITDVKGFKDDTAVQSDSELDKTVLSGYLEILPGTSVDVSLEYALPRSTWNIDIGHSYSLRVQKEAGTLSDPLTVSVRLPDSIQATAWTSDLTTDRDFSIAAIH